MSIVVSNNQFIKQLGKGAISASEESNRILAYVPQAEMLVEKAVGAEIMEWLSITSENQISWLTTEQKKLFFWVERAVCFYAYWYYLPYSLGSEGDMGLQEENSENTKAARIGVLEKRLTASVENGAMALEKALQLMFENAYSVWVDTDAYKQAKALFIRFGYELGVALPPSGGSYRMFLTLRNWLADAEENYIRPILGSDYFDALKAGLSDDTLSDIERKLLGYVQKYEAFAAFFDALDYMVIQATPNGLRVLSEFDGINNRKAPSSEDMGVFRVNLERKVKECRDHLLGFIGLNAASFPEIAAGGGVVVKSGVPNFLKEYKRSIQL